MSEPRKPKNPLNSQITIICAAAGLAVLIFLIVQNAQKTNPSSSPGMADDYDSFAAPIIATENMDSSGSSANTELREREMAEISSQQEAQSEK